MFSRYSLLGFTRNVSDWLRKGAVDRPGINDTARKGGVMVTGSGRGNSGRAAMIVTEHLGAEVRISNVDVEFRVDLVRVEVGKGTPRSILTRSHVGVGGVFSRR